MNCPPCTGTCQNTRNCPARMVTRNGGNVITNGVPLPPRTPQIEMINRPLEWLRDLLYAAIYVGGSVLLGVLLLAAMVLATGLHRYLF